LRQSLGIDLSDEDFIEGWNDVYLGPVPGMSEVLSVAQRHLPLFAFTNSNPTHKSVWEHLYANELRPFQTIFVSSEHSHELGSKSSPEGYWGPKA
jgi:putative hydrolase of the HAD superfamily